MKPIIYSKLFWTLFKYFFKQPVSIIIFNKFKKKSKLFNYLAKSFTAFQ